MLVISSPRNHFSKKSIKYLIQKWVVCLYWVGGGDVGHFLYGRAVLMVAFGQIAKDPGLRPVFIHRPFCDNAHALCYAYKNECSWGRSVRNKDSLKQSILESDFHNACKKDIYSEN